MRSTYIICVGYVKCIYNIYSKWANMYVYIRMYKLHNELESIQSQVMYVNIHNKTLFRQTHTLSVHIHI